jgi:hypothetical protein
MSEANIHNANLSAGDFEKELDSMHASGCLIKTRHSTMVPTRRTLLMASSMSSIFFMMVENDWIPTEQ